MSLPRVTVGPVLGKPGSTSARVLVEVSGNAAVECILTPASGSPVPVVRPA